MDDAPQLRATPEMVLVMGLVRVVLPHFPKRERREIIRDLDAWFTKLNGRPPWRVARFIGKKDDDVVTSRDEAAAWWTMARDALLRDMD